MGNDRRHREKRSRGSEKPHDANLLVGKHAVTEALRSGVPLKRICIAEGVERDASINEIERTAREEGIQLDLLSRNKIDAMCSDGVKGARGVAHQGVIAQAMPFEYADISQIYDASDASEDARALVVVCDHITDAGNLGAIIRSAESVGAIGVVIPNKRSAQVTPTTYKTSAGAVSCMRIAQVPNIGRVLDDLKRLGFWVVAATEHAEDLLWNTDMRGKVALVMGNEQNGISELALKSSDFKCKLPQEGQISSLNVAQASTVFMYEWLRQNVE